MAAPVAGAGAIVSADGLAKKFETRWVFRGVSFELSHGDVMVVTGPNGSGKSTLLKVVAGLLEPSGGRVSFRDQDLRNSLGLSALDQAVYPTLTVWEHLELSARLRGCEARPGELLEQVGLDYAKDYLASQLSTGMRARLKLALATQPRPSLLLLDEPGAGMDEQGRAVLDVLIHDQKTRGALMLATNEAAERRYANLELKLGG